MELDRVFETVDALHATYVEYLREICEIESPTNDKAGVDAVGAWFLRKAEQFGWECEVHREEISGDALCLTMNPTAAGRPIAISAHMDTVFPVGLFGSPAVRVEGDKIYGPGVTDCKGGLIGCMLAMEALQRNGFCARPVRFLLQSDEETGSVGSEKRTVAFMAEKARDCVAFLNCEGYMDRGLITVERKGIARYRFDITGRAVHSSLCFQGVNAIAEAAHKILALEVWKEDQGLTFNVGTIEGGTVANTVPEQCSFSLDVRYATQEQLRKAEEFIHSVAQTSYLEGTQCSVTRVGYRVSMERKAENLDLAARVSDISEQIGFGPLTPVSRRGGADSADMSACGIPSVDSIGLHGGRIHSTDEFAFLDSIARCAKTLAACIVRL